MEESCAAGEVLFRKGDPANRLYVIRPGHVAFPELRKMFRDGQVFGEVGLFAPKNVRCRARLRQPSRRERVRA